MDIFKRSSEIVVDKKRQLRCGMKAHWFLKKEYKLSFAGMGEVLGNPDNIADVCFYLHALLITDDSSLKLDDVFNLVDNYGLDVFLKGVTDLFNEGSV